MIDWNRVAQLRDEIGAEDFAEVVELFLMEVGTTIQQLFDAEGNPVVTEDQMHFLKGAALNIGFRDLAELCRKGEAAIGKGNTRAVSPTEVQLVFETSRAQFERDYEKRFAA